MVEILSFGFFLLVFIVIGLASLRESQQSNVDYLLAGHSMKPWLVALSAVATNNSGYMFTGMIGFTYMFGWPSVWLMAGWLLGDFIGSLIIHKKIRIVSEAHNIHSFSGILSYWNGANYRVLRLVVGVISLLFLGSYAAAQLNAGSKALHVLFGWDISVGAIIGSVIVLVYCFAGGIRASIWTDAAQSVVMLGSMAMLLFVAVSSVGGWHAAVSQMRSIDGFLNWFPPDLPVKGALGPVLFVAGWMFAGFGVIGQPHVMIRFMTMDDPANIRRVRIYYYLWFFVFYALTIGVGMMSRLLIPQVQNFDAELALPLMSLKLLPGVLVGLMLAGLFAATMSTADSLILSCSAVLTRDFLPGKRPFLVTKIGTLVVTAVALVIALTGNKSVFKLVLYSWAVLAAAFGPLLTVYCLNQKPSQTLALLMVLGGTAAVFAWTYLQLSGWIYEIVPGFLAGFLIFGIGKLLGMNQPEELALTPESSEK